LKNTTNSQNSGSFESEKHHTNTTNSQNSGSFSPHKHHKIVAELCQNTKVLHKCHTYNDLGCGPAPVSRGG